MMSDLLSLKSSACSPVELFKGPKPVASSAPGVRFREPISLEDVTDTKQRCVLQMS